MLLCLGSRYQLLFGMTNERTELEEEKVIRAFWPIFKSYSICCEWHGMQLDWEESKKMAMAKAEA